MNLKHLFKRGALLAAANWQVVAVQFIAETTYQALLAVPIIGAAILVAVLLGGDLAELLQGSMRDIFRAGMRPTNRAVIAATAIAMPSTRLSTAISCSRGSISPPNEI